MDIQDLSISVNIPTIEDFLTEHSNYSNLARVELNYLFKLVMSAESFWLASVVTDELDLPAVAGIAKRCSDIIDTHAEQKPVGLVNQFIGAAMSCLMQANGYEKTGIKRAIPHPRFTKGEVYRRKE